jgi:hypothetical protein
MQQFYCVASKKSDTYLAIILYYTSSPIIKRLRNRF